MADATCRRELDLEIPAEEISKQTEKIAKEFAKMARVPGFRPGKAPITLIKKRFAEDIKGEVLQSLVPERVEKAVSEQKAHARFSAAGREAGFRRRPAAEVPRHLRSPAGIRAWQLQGSRNRNARDGHYRRDLAKTLEEMRERAAASRRSKAGPSRTATTCS